MEKVWSELKKIDLQAEDIRTEAHKKSELIIDLAKKEAKQLIMSSKIYAEEASQHLYSKALQEANSSYEEKLRKGEEDGKKLKHQAEKNLEKAADAVVKAVIGE